MKFIAIILSLIVGCSHTADNEPKLSNEIFTVEYNNQMHSRVISNLPDANLLMSGFSPSEQLSLADMSIKDFTLEEVKHFKEENFVGITLTGNYSDGKIQIKKIIKAEIQKDFPDFWFCCTKEDTPDGFAKMLTTKTFFSDMIALEEQLLTAFRSVYWTRLCPLEHPVRILHLAKTSLYSLTTVKAFK